MYIYIISHSDTNACTYIAYLQWTQALANRGSEEIFELGYVVFMVIVRWPSKSPENFRDQAGFESRNEQGGASWLSWLIACISI